MKAFSRKVSYLVVVMLVLVLVLAACNRDNGEEEESGTQPPPPATNGGTTDGGETAPPDVPAHRGNIHEPRDLGGRTIVGGAWWEGFIPFSIHQWEEPDPATAGNYFIDRMVWENGLRVREEFNFEYEEVIIGDFGEVMTVLTSSVLAGDPFADIMLLSGGWVLPAYHGNLIVPLDEINLPGSDLFGPQIYSRFEGYLFGRPWSFVDSRPNTGGFSLGINLDLINAIGAANPVDLYNQGRWTWDAMLEIMRLATRDTTGDGIFDQFGIAGQPGDLAYYFIGANDGRMVDDDLNYWLDHPNTIVALEFLEIIFREGLWEYDRAHGFDTGDWSRNFFAFQDGNSAFFPAVLWALNDGDLPFEFAVVPWPTGPNNTTGSTWMTGFDQGLAFPIGSSWDPAEILMVVEEFWSWAGDDMDLMHEDGFSWARSILPTEEDVQRQASVTNTRVSDIGMHVPYYNWIFGTFISHFATQAMTVQQVVETYRGPQQDLLDNFFRN